MHPVLCKSFSALHFPKARASWFVTRDQAVLDSDPAWPPVWDVYCAATCIREILVLNDYPGEG